MQLNESIVGSSSIAGGSERDLLRRRSSVGVGTKSRADCHPVGAGGLDLQVPPHL